MADTFLRDYAAARLKAYRAGLFAVLVMANGMIIAITRLDTGELRASVVVNWAEGRHGGSRRPPAGLRHHPVPSNDAARLVAADFVPGRSVSTTSLVVQSLWLPIDQTFEQVAAAINSAGVIST